MTPGPAYRNSARWHDHRAPMAHRMDAGFLSSEAAAAEWLARQRAPASPLSLAGAVLGLAVGLAVIGAWLWWLA